MKHFSARGRGGRKRREEEGVLYSHPALLPPTTVYHIAHPPRAVPISKAAPEIERGARRR